MYYSNTFMIQKKKINKFMISQIDLNYGLTMTQNHYSNLMYSWYNIDNTHHYLTE